MNNCIRAFSVGVLLLAGCGRDGAESGSTGVQPVARGGNGLGGDARQIAEARDLTPDDVTAALKTYMPTGRHDDYIMFSSGGHSGQVFVIGMPSMRLLRTIGVFTPESWQGWGYGVGNEILEQGNIGGKELRWGDTHHPALSETGGDYDGQFLFINDKANARVAVIDLRDFETKQIVNNPIALNDHGGTFVTPDSEYVIEGGQYGSPLAGEYAPLRSTTSPIDGMVTLWKFDRDKGPNRHDQGLVRAGTAAPYWQDLFDAARRSARAGSSATRSTPSWPRAPRRSAIGTSSRPVSASVTTTTCT